MWNVGTMDHANIKVFVNSTRMCYRDKIRANRDRDLNVDASR